jgi:hypothetical protein
VEVARSISPHFEVDDQLLFQSLTVENVYKMEISKVYVPMYAFLSRPWVWHLIILSSFLSDKSIMLLKRLSSQNSHHGQWSADAAISRHIPRLFLLSRPVSDL